MAIFPTDKRSLAALNGLLLSAENTFDWRTLQEEVKKPLLQRERGFEILGNVNGWSNGKGEISFFQRNTGQFVTTSIADNGHFRFSNSDIERQENINFSVRKNGKNPSYPEITIDVIPVTLRDTVSLEERYVAVIMDVDKVVGDVTVPEVTEASGIQLEEVQLQGNSKKEAVFVQNPQLAKSAFYEAKKIRLEETKKYPLLSSYIRTLGFRVSTNAVEGVLFILARNPRDLPPIIFVDGFREVGSIPDETLNAIDEVYYKTNVFYESCGGTIYIYRKVGSFVGSETNAVVSLSAVGSETNAVVSLSAAVGFEKTQAYFNETLSSRFDAFTKKYGAVYWDGAIDFGGEENVTISFPRYGLKGVRVVIQAVDQMGVYFVKDEIVYFE
ncbi:MAG: hypothetical protein ACJARZ_000209 [Dokdonia sp.]|jgi:hypothetical protein